MDINFTTPPEPEEVSKRKRGAPAGNINALKHGFYSKRFNTGELLDLDNITEGSISEEIAMMRVITRRVVDLMENGATNQEVLDFYKIIGQMCMQISALLRTQKILDAGSQGKVDLLSYMERVSSAFFEIGRKP